ALHAAASRGLSTPSHEQEWRFPAPIGTRWVLVQAEPLLDGHGRPRGAVEAVVDITPLKRAMQRLAQARDRLQQAQHLMDAAQLAGRVGFLRYDFEADELRTTRGLAALFNSGVEPPLFDDSGHGILSAGVALQAPQTLASWLRQLGRADRLALQRAIAEMAAQHRSTYELSFTLPESGEARHASARLLMRFDGSGRPAELMGVVVDTSEQQRAVENRSRMAAEEQNARLAAEAASTAKDDLLAMLGHELRNPLNALSAAVEVMKSLQQPSDALASEAREVIERQARQLTRLTNEFLDMARLTSGAEELDLRPTDLHAVVATMVDEVRPTAEAAGRTLEGGGSTAWISADRVRIGQMLRKLFDHALSRAGTGGGVHVHVAPDSRGVVLRIGWVVRAAVPVAGDASEVATLSGNDAAQADPQAHGGMTLGLEWASTLADLHGSRIEWRRTRAGAEATLRLNGLPAPIVKPAVVPITAPHVAAPRTLLLVEDNQDAARSLGAALQLEGHRVTYADDGLQGLSLLLAERPEVAVVDIGLPGIGGLSLARQARGAGYSGLMIALSGYVSEEDTAKALRAGFDAFVPKPADLDRLNALIASRS
ncbi:MAG TPA: response regulator, partial [Rubrivivax sp.]|nr:response regulator [Rubrivivax sp.]